MDALIVRMRRLQLASPKSPQGIAAAISAKRSDLFRYLGLPRYYEQVAIPIAGDSRVEIPAAALRLSAACLTGEVDIDFSARNAAALAFAARAHASSFPGRVFPPAAPCRHVGLWRTRRDMAEREHSISTISGSTAGPACTRSLVLHRRSILNDRPFVKLIEAIHDFPHSGQVDRRPVYRDRRRCRSTKRRRTKIPNSSRRCGARRRTPARQPFARAIIVAEFTERVPPGRRYRCASPHG